jgi:hypothetical protein
MLSNQYPYRKWIYVNGKRLDLEAFINWLYHLWAEQKEIEKKALTNAKKSHQTSINKYHYRYSTGFMYPRSVTQENKGHKNLKF